ncbi:hypothetical protein J3S85_31040 [Streptomyces lavenduligriseus]|nr:hypothetical protein J3S85_31040 [Streptomyces lavenduligriseus]
MTNDVPVRRLEEAPEPDARCVGALPPETVAAWLHERIGKRETDGVRRLGLRRTKASRNQQRLWHRHQATAAGDHSAPFMLRRISGHVDVPALASALDAVVERHEILRTTYHASGPDVYQVVNTPVPIGLREEILSGASATERQRMLREAVESTVRHAFDLENGSVIRARFFALGPGEHALLLVVHHIAIDVWSSAVLLADLAETYQAIRERRQPRLPAMPVQYSDFSEWQRQGMQLATQEGDRRYWRAQLRGVPPGTTLVHGRLLTATPSRTEVPLPVHVSATDVADMEHLGRGVGASIFMVLLSAFSYVVAQWSGRWDVVVGCPVPSRPVPEVEPLVGLFVNMLPLRTRVTPSDTFRQLLERVRDTTLDGYDHQQLFFEDIAREASPAEEASQEPLVRIAFAYDEVNASPRAAQGLGKPMTIPFAGQQHYDLSAVVTRFDDGVRGTVSFPAGLFDPSAIQRFVHDFLNTLGAAVRNPDCPLRNLPARDICNTRGTASPTDSQSGGTPQ